MFMRRIVGSLFFLFLLACDASNAPDHPSSHGVPGPVRSPVGFVVDGEDGPLEVRLAEVNAAADESVAALAQARLAALLEEAGGQVELVFTGAERDRYGRAPVHAEYAAPGGRVWIQGVMVSEGLLVVASRADNRARAGALLALERQAREAGEGGWGSGAFAVRAPDPNALAQVLDSFQIVEGRVIDVGSARSGRLYINFGLDWRTDFTVSIREDALERFEGIDLAGLEGRTIRVRGWLYRENGPMMAIDHPEAIEVFGD